jgi:hypothetical protein
VVTKRCRATSSDQSAASAALGGDLHVKQATIPADGAPSFGGWSSLGPIALPAGAPPTAPVPVPAPQPAAPLITLAPTISYQFSSGRRTTRLTALNVTAVQAALGHGALPAAGGHAAAGLLELVAGDEFAADDHALDFAGAFADQEQGGVAVEAFDLVFLGVAVAAVDAEGVFDDFFAGL